MTQSINLAQFRSRSSAPEPRPARFKLLTVGELEALPQPEWLIKGILRAESQVVLYGYSGHGKSFVAVDMALSIASGRPWFGRSVVRGPVVYVVAEGGRGILKRVLAWKEARQPDNVGSVFFLLDAVQLRQPKDVEAFLGVLGRLEVNPRLIVLDTFARSFVGGEENSAKEVGEWIEASRQIQTKTGATVMAVHHTGKPREGGPAPERGSSALRAASETMISVVATKKKVTVACSKQKDDECFDDIGLRHTPVFVGVTDGEPVTSAVLELYDSETANGTVSPEGELPDGLRRALEALSAMPSSHARSGAWQAALGTDGKRVPDTSFHRWRKDLIERGLVEETPGSRGEYRVVPPAVVLPAKFDGMSPSPTATPQTPLGVGVAVGGREEDEGEEQ